MKLSQKLLSAALLSAVLVSLTACSSGNNGEADPTVSQAPPSAAEPSAAGGSSEPAAETSQPQSAEASTVPSTKEADPAAAEQISKLLKSAKEGKIPGIPFAAHSNIIDDVRDSWGEADTDEMAGKGFYATYSEHHAVFGYNKGSQLFDVRSDSPEIQKLTLEDIRQVLGDPAGTATSGTDQIYIYNAGKQYQLKFIFAEGSKTVDHISVFAPADSFNNMQG